MSSGPNPGFHSFGQKYLGEGSTGLFWNTYQYWCPHSLEEISRPGYWSSARGLLQPGDRLSVTCMDANGEPTAYAEIAVIAISNRHDRITEPAFSYRKKAISRGVNPDSPVTSVEVAIMSWLKLSEDEGEEIEEEEPAPKPVKHQESSDEAGRNVVRGAAGRFSKRRAA